MTLPPCRRLCVVVCCNKELGFRVGWGSRLGSLEFQGGEVVADFLPFGLFLFHSALTLTLPTPSLFNTSQATGPFIPGLRPSCASSEPTPISLSNTVAVMALKDWAFPVGVLAVLWGALHLAVRRVYPMPPPGNRAVVVVSGTHG